MRLQSVPSYLNQLATRMRERESAAFREFGGLFGPAFQEVFRSAGVPESDLDVLALKAVYKASTEIIGRESGPPDTAIESAVQSGLKHYMEQLAGVHADLRLAADLQAQLLERDPPQIPGLEIAVRFLPARVLTGDLFAVFNGNIFLGDASGKGSPAAIYAALLLGSLRSHAVSRLSLRGLMAQLNELLFEHRVGQRYATLIAARWSRASGTVSLCSAGAPAPIRISNGRAQAVRLEGFPLGMCTGVAYESKAVQLRPGDSLVLYSDGVVDQEDCRGLEFGEERLATLLESIGALYP